MSSCCLCDNRQLAKQLQHMTFCQSSDKGYVRCEVMITVHVCDTCGMQTVEEGTDKIMDEAFVREYRNKARLRARVS